METYSALLALCAGNSPVNSPHKSQWRGAWMFSLTFSWINDWINNREAGNLRRHCGHCDVNVMTRVYSEMKRILDADVMYYSIHLTSVNCTYTSVNLPRDWWRSVGDEYGMQFDPATCIIQINLPVLEITIFRRICIDLKKKQSPFRGDIANVIIQSNAQDIRWWNH